MDIQDILKENVSKGKNKTYKNEIVEFHRGGIESKNEYSFIPFASISRIYLGQLPSTTTLNPKTLLLAVVAGIVGLLLFITVKWWGILLGIISFVAGIITILRSFKSTNWYALNIDMASSAVYSFIADKKEHIDEGYRFLLETINEREENRKGGFDFKKGIRIDKIEKVIVETYNDYK